jgi:hypothetical protein
MQMKHTIISTLLVLIISQLHAQEIKKDSVPAEPAKPKSEWYKKLSIRGYTQVRYNRLLETNNDLQCEQCDRSWGANGGVFIRRARVILYGQVHERVYIYIQPDFASSASSTAQNFAQLRDAYFDLGLNKKNEFRLRIGQSKVPFGFENLQSSQNRLPLDRSDGINSALANERDLGMFFYWAPAKTRELFSHLVNSGLKGSGDYGVFGAGFYNGQTANRPDANQDVHWVARLSYPLQVGGQIIEPGIQGYAGDIVVTTVTSGIAGKPGYEYSDQRVAGSLILYAQPFGLNAEYNVGTGPEYNRATNSIEQRKLKGGYVQASFMGKAGDQLIIPFVRYHSYDGGKKHELDARSYNVKETELGIEWQPIKNFEVVAMYTISERRFEDANLTDDGTIENFEKGRLLRLQLQFNY